MNAKKKINIIVILIIFMNIIIFTFLICPVLFSTPALNTNLIVNPSFESGITKSQAPEQNFSSTYYVALNGNDNNSGTESQPWRTISKAARTVDAGGTVYVMEGVYNEQVWVENSGSPDKWITFAAYPGQSVTIDGTGLPMGRDYGLFNILGKCCIKVTGFRIINSEYSGFYVTQGKGVPSSNIIFSHNYLEKTLAAAIIMF